MVALLLLLLLPQAPHGVVGLPCCAVAADEGHLGSVCRHQKGRCRRRSQRRRRSRRAHTSTQLAVASFGRASLVGRAPSR